MKLNFEHRFDAMLNNGNPSNVPDARGWVWTASYCRRPLRALGVQRLICNANLTLLKAKFRRRIWRKKPSLTTHLPKMCTQRILYHLMMISPSLRPLSLQDLYHHWAPRKQCRGHWVMWSWMRRKSMTALHCETSVRFPRVDPGFRFLNVALP